MIAVDTNLLVYAHREDSPWHREAVEVVRSLAEGSRSWGIPWPCIHEFLAIVTHPKIYRPPTPLATAIRSIQSWMESPTLHLLGEGPAHFKALEKLLVASKASGALVHDARVAAICLANGVEQLWSSDRDFSRFPGLKIRNPLITK